MSNILKKLSALIVMLVFMSLFSVVVSATETTQNTSRDGNVILSEDEYNNLIERVEELEQLKADEINNNLFDYYEKSKADRETGISEIFNGLAITVGVLGIAVTLLLAGTAFFNYREMKNVAEKAEKTNKKAQKTNENAEETNKKAEEKFSELDETKKNLDLYRKTLDLYIKKAKAQTSNDLDLNVRIYTEVIEEMEQYNIKDEDIYFQRGNTYLLKFRLKMGMVENYQNDINIEIKNLEKIFEHSYLADEYKYLLADAISDFQKFLEKSTSNYLYDTTKLKIIESLIYKQEYKKLCNEVNREADYEIARKEMLKVLALIFVKTNLYETFKKNVDEEIFNSISLDLYWNHELLFNRIFANEIVFNSFIACSNPGNRGIEDLNESKEIAYTELMKSLDDAYNLFKKLSEDYFYVYLEHGGSFDTLLDDLLDDFTTCTKIRNSTLEMKQASFFVFNEYCRKYLRDLPPAKYDSILLKVNEIIKYFQNMETKYFKDIKKRYNEEDLDFMNSQDKIETT